MLDILKSALATVAFLFGAFNSFFEKFAPPPIRYETGDTSTTNLTTGLVKILCLGLLLLISLVSHMVVKKHPDQGGKIALRWLVMCIVLFAGLSISSYQYYQQYQEKTIAPFGSDRYMRGQLNNEALKVCKEVYSNRDLLSCEMELMKDATALEMDQYLVPGSREQNRKTLETWYFLLVIFCAALLFSLAEALGWQWIKNKPEGK